MHSRLSAHESGRRSVTPYARRTRGRGYLSGKVSFEYCGKPVSEPTPYGPAEVVILGAWIQGGEGCLAAPLLSPLYIDGEAVSFACLSRRLTVAREMR